MAAVPHVSLVREDGTSQVYLVCAGTKLPVPSEEEFNRLGFQSGRVRVVPPGTLADLPQRPLVPPVAVKPSDVFFDCGTDYDTPNGPYRWNCQGSFALVRHDVLVAGWLTDPPWPNVLGPAGCEDVHYNIWLDPDFVDRMYGPRGLSTALNGLVYRGNPRQPLPNPPLAVADIAGDGVSAGITYNSFILPGNDMAFDVHGELNAWHVNDTGDLFTRHFKGRGAAPAGWQRIPVVGSGDKGEGWGDDDPWFPFGIYAPHGSEALSKDDYVLMRGSLWQDHNHGVPSVWDEGPTRHHAAWAEIHPIDWILRLQPRAPNQRATVGRLAVCTPLLDPAPVSADRTIEPGFAATRPGRTLAVAGVLTLRDRRMTVPASVTREEVVQDGAVVRVSAEVQGNAAGQGRLKAAYVVRWRETDPSDVVWVNDTLPSGAQPAGHEDAWTWVSENPPPFMGSRAHQSSVRPGRHQHYFTHAANGLAIGPAEILVCAAYLDPDFPPEQLMLQWYDGTWEHRAYWGANRIGWGTNGTPSRWPMGPLPETGTWIRLEVLASRVGLEQRLVTGMAFTLFGGRATWDYAGKSGVFRDATLLGLTVPPSMIIGREAAVSVRLRNSGSPTWTRAAGYRLGAQDPQDTTRWGINRVELPHDVPPGEDVTFNFAVTPHVVPGTYPFQWRMLQEGVAWFGQATPSKQVRVVRPPIDE